MRDREVDAHRNCQYFVQNAACGASMCGISVDRLARAEGVALTPCGRSGPPRSGVARALDDLPGAMDNLSSFEHASLDSFKIYVTLMDMIMYEQFRGVALDELLNAGKTTYDKAAYTVELPDWKPIIRGLKINAGATVFQHVNSGTDGNLFYYKTDDTIIRQIIFYGGFIMPSIGTSRYMGFYRLDADNELTHATLSEYYIGLVIAAYFLPVLSTERREQVLELIPEGPL